jgi:hypothetical protein
MWRWLGATLVVMVTAGGAAMGCGSGLSESDAKLRCDQEQASKEQCVTSKAYEECIKCVEDCGNDCQPQAKCPEEYKCGSPAP